MPPLLARILVTLFPTHSSRRCTVVWTSTYLLHTIHLRTFLHTSAWLFSLATKWCLSLQDFSLDSDSSPTFLASWAYYISSFDCFFLFCLLFSFVSSFLPVSSCQRIFKKKSFQCSPALASKKLVPHKRHELPPCSTTSTERMAVGELGSWQAGKLASKRKMWKAEAGTM